MSVTDFNPRVYVPVADTFLHRIAHPGSAVVGRAHEDIVAVYYEGNAYGAVNMVTLADRAMFAYYWRLRDAYPTVAQALAAPEEVIDVGYLDTERCRIVLDGYEGARRIADWIGATDGGWALEPELQVSGVRA